MAADILLELQHIDKKFGTIVALKDVSFSVRRGEIHGLIGENGSGKSTITSIAAGMQAASEGEMLFLGEKWKPHTMIEAQQHGISMILQEANTISGCTVAENLFAGQEDRFSRFGFMQMKKMNAEADQLLESFGISGIRAKDAIDHLGFEERKLVEIVRAVTAQTQLLIVDETTTALSYEGRQILYNLMRKMTSEGKAVIFISHDLDEILEHCTILTVLRDGEIRGVIEKDEMNLDQGLHRMRNLMVGRDIGNEFYRKDSEATAQDETALLLQNVTSREIRDFSLEVRKGEIVGIGGLSGCGMHEIGRLAFGADHIESGEVLCHGKQIHSVSEAVRMGVGYISKNRDQEALILEGSIDVNIVMPSLSDLKKGIFITPTSEDRVAAGQISLLEIKCENGKQWVNTLSGGNKQKVSFAKWLAKGSDIVIMDCPTRGVDIGVKQAMYRLILEMKQSGKAILLISEELAELIGMSDRLIVMKDFKVSKEFQRSADLKEIDIIEYMI